jgi:ATP-dependent DNA helicase DinG
VSPSIALPDAPSVVAGHGRAAILTPDGELLVLPTAEAAALLRTLPPPILVHAPATFRRLGLRPGLAFDLLDLFAFVRRRPRHAAWPWRWTTILRRSAWKPR